APFAARCARSRRPSWRSSTPSWRPWPSSRPGWRPSSPAAAPGRPPGAAPCSPTFPRIREASVSPRLRNLLAGMALTAAVSSAAAAPATAPAVDVLQRGYVAAWDRADAPAIAAYFAPDGDFTNPTGFHAQGRADVAAFDPP